MACRAVELIRREILKVEPSALNVNAVLIDFFLYDLAKEREFANTCESMAHRYCPLLPRIQHRTVHPES